MRASRSSTRARTAPWIAVPSTAVLLSVLLSVLIAAPSLGADPRAEARKAAEQAKAAAARAESLAAATEEGFSVRVIEDSKGGKTTRKTIRIQGSDKGITIETPEPPVPPEPPDLDHGDSNDLVRFGEDITIPANKVVEGDVVTFGGTITVLGRVKGTATAIGGSVHVRGNGVVEGDAVSMGGTVTTSDSATVGGSNVSLGAWNMRGFRQWGPAAGVFGLIGAGAWLTQTLFWVLVTTLFAWLTLLLFRERFLHANEALAQRFGMSFLWGLLGWVALVFAVPIGIVALVIFSVIAIVILCITIIGIPVAILLAIGMVLGIIALVAAAGYVAFLGYLEGALYLGRRVLGNRAQTAAPLLAILIGVALIAGLDAAGELIGALSFFLFHPIGMALGLAATFILIVLSTAGLGSLLLTRFSAGPGAGAANQWGWTPTPPAPVPPGAAPPPPAGGMPGAPPAGPRPSTEPPEGGTSDAP